MTKITVVDAEDNILCYKEKSELLQGEIIRCSVLWIASPAGEILLQRRIETKKTSPGLWDVAAAGQVEESETYREAVIREAREELGVHIEPVEFRKFFRKDKDQFFSMWFTATLHKKTRFTPDPSEVMEVRWWKREELIQRIAAHPEEFVPSAPQWMERF